MDPKRDSAVEYGERSVARMAGNIAAGLIGKEVFTATLEAQKRVAATSIALAREILRQIREQADAGETR